LSSTGPDAFDESEVARRVGVSVERVRRLVDLGILHPQDGAFGRRDVLHARIVEALDDKGIPSDAVGAALGSGDLPSLAILEDAGRRHPRSERTFRQVADDMGVSFETLERIYIAFGLPRPAADESVREEDLEAIRGLPILLGAGVGEGQVLQMARVWGDGVRRIAQYQTHYLHAVIEEPFRGRGMGGFEAYEAAVTEVGLRMGRLGEVLIGWLLRRHAETFTTEHQFGHIEDALEAAGVRPRTPRGVGAAAFADLTGYTSLTEEAGDETAAEVSLTLARLVSEVAADHEGEVVKMLGDGVHFHFREPADAVRASLEIVRAVRPNGLPPAHIGVNAGPMIYDEGDYFGRTVNVAARIAAKASADQVFAGEDLTRVVEPDGFAFRDAGAFELKGIAEPVRVFEVVVPNAHGRPRASGRYDRSDAASDGDDRPRESA
jgi:adenylate cyclase